MSGGHAPALNPALDHVSAVSVSYSDLNLSSPGGRLALQGRVNRAASRLCDAGGRRSLDEKVGEARCLSAALSKAERDVDQAVAGASGRDAANLTVRLASK
jgi:UrcA family protein